MNNQLKSFSWSLAFHALIFTSIIALSRSMPASKPLVIDFNIAGSQELNAEGHRDTPSQSQRSSVMNRKSVVRSQKSEVKSQKPETKETEQKLVPPSLNNTPITSMSDNQSPVLSDISQDTNDKKASVDTVNAGSNSSSENIKKYVATASGIDASAITESAKAGYLREHFTYIRDTIMKNLSYPQIARKMGWSGKVTISFVICESGDAEDIKIIESSGFAILDNNAVETLKKVLPLPKPPLRAEIIIPVVYRLN